MSKAIPARKELAAKAVRHQHQTRVRESRVALSSSGKTATAIASQQKQIERLQVELKEMRRAAQEKESREAQEKESREAQERLIDSIKASGAEISQLRFSQKTGPDAEKREQIKLRYDELQEKIKSDIGSLKENDPNAAKKIEDQLKELQDLQIFKEKATRRIRSLETENKKIQSAGDTLQLNIDSINETLKSERVQNNLLRQEGENLEETLRTTKLSLEAKNGENTELNTQLSEARSKIKNVSKLNSILSESLEAEKNNKGILQEELSSNAELLRDTQGQNSSLQQEK